MKTYELVYHYLSKHNDYISGENLAEQLKVSRTSIWKAIQQLEKQGLVISSTKHRGYRLIKGDLLLPEWLGQKLPLSIHYKVDSQSTQLDAKQGIEEGLAANSLYLAPSQTGAKGRFGRQFFTPKQGGIYMSLHLKPMKTFDQMPVYTMLVAASIIKAIKDLTGIQAQIKWVNDIYLGKQKIAGILTEAVSSVESGLITDVIIGVGLNFHIESFPEELHEKAGSLFNEQPSISRNDLIVAIWKTFLESDERELLTIYKSNSLVLGKQITFQQNGQTYRGQAIELSDQGQLLVHLENGSNLWLQSGEISLSSWTR